MNVTIGWGHVHIEERSFLGSVRQCSLKRKSKMSVKLASCVTTVSCGSPMVQSTEKGGRADIVITRKSEGASLGEQGFHSR